MASIQFDGTEILNTTYVPRYVKHESAPDREVMALVPAREDGEVLVSERYGRKVIPLRGILVGTSQADLESKVDAFKELFSRLERNLDVDWNGSTRRYVATCTRHEFDRDHFNVGYVPWTAEFTVLSGEGKDVSSTTARNAGVTLTTPATDSFTLSGSKPPRPVIRLTGNSWSTSEVKGVEYRNNDTGERIILTKNALWASNSVVEFDCDAKRVRHDIGQALAEGNFYGVFPKFRIGSNSVRITAGGIVNQKSADTLASQNGNSTLLNGTSKRFAQSFQVPYGDDTFQGIVLCLEKVGSPGNVTVRIESDSGNKPSGNFADPSGSGSQMTITAASVSGRAYYTGWSAAPFALSANVRYWLVVSAASVGPSDYYDLYFADTANGTYAKGKAIQSTDAGANWTDSAERNLSFSVLFGGKRGSSQGATHLVTYRKTYL